MRHNKLIVIASLGAWLLVMPQADSLAQSAGRTSRDYVNALYAAIYPHWASESYSNDLQPGSTCAARIVQIPGGDILSVDILPECAFGKEGQAALITAAHQSVPLPYRGYESFYQREIRMVFHAASASDREAKIAAAAANQRSRDEKAESDKQWDAKMLARVPYDKYAPGCSAHLQLASSRIRFRHRTEVMVTVDKAGKVIAVADVLQHRLDKEVIAAFMAMPPCRPVPDDLANAAGAVKIGPIDVNNWAPDPPGVSGICHDASGQVCPK